MDMIVIEKEIEGGLIKYRWEFYNIKSFEFILQYYGGYYRSSKRHSWKSKDRYDRLSKGNTNMAFEDVPFTDDVAELAKQQLIEIVKFTKNN